MTASAVESFDLKCKVTSKYWNPVGQIEYCDAQNVYITSKDETITSVNGRTVPTCVRGLWIDGQTVNYLPKGINKFFPNLEMLAVENSHLKSLTQDD